MDIDLDIDCPECGAPVRVSMRDVARERMVRCRNAHAISLVDEGGGARSADRALADLDRALKRLGGR